MVLFIIVLWRVLLFGVAAWTQRYFLFTPRFPYSDIYLIPSKLPQWVWGWANFDGVHYLAIARSGYFAQYTQAFFPLYPLLIRILGIILQDNSFIFSGLLISLLCLYFGLISFKELLKFDYSSSVVKSSLGFLLIFPTSFYFGALYTESIFFLFTMLAFLMARRKQWWISAVFGMLASATRITGIFLLPPLLMEWLVISKIPQMKTFRQKLIKIFTILLTSPYLYIVPIGLLSYMTYLYLFYGDAFYFWHAQSAFGAARTSSIILLPQVTWRYLKILTTSHVSIDAYFAAWLEFVSFWFGAAMLLIGHKYRIRISYLVFGWLVLIVPTLTGTFSSLPRYIILIFPMYIVLGLIKNIYIRCTLIFCLSSILILLCSWFIRGMWVG